MRNFGFAASRRCSSLTSGSDAAMLRYGLAYAATAIVFLALDFVWLSFASPNFYRPRLGDLLLERPNLPVAALFYAFYAVAIVILAAVPANNQGNWLLAIGLGAVLGAAAYGTYDITNLATVKGWSVAVTVVDIAWGMTVSALAALAGYLVLSRGNAGLS